MSLCRRLKFTRRRSVFCVLFCFLRIRVSILLSPWCPASFYHTQVTLVHGPSLSAGPSYAPSRWKATAPAPSRGAVPPPHFYPGCLSHIYGACQWYMLSLRPCDTQGGREDGHTCEPSRPHAQPRRTAALASCRAVESISHPCSEMSSEHMVKFSQVKLSP